MRHLSAGVTLHPCARKGCDKPGRIRSDRWNAFLCSEHLTSGPEGEADAGSDRD